MAMKMIMVFAMCLELQVINDLRIGVYCHDAEQKFGVDIVYGYNFGIPQKRESKVWHCRPMYFRRLLAGIIPSGL